MSQISKHKLDQKVYKKIFSLFPQFLTRLSKVGKSSVLINTLLSNTEKMVFAKRLSISFMLIKGYTYPMISDKLKVSFGTIAKVAELTKNADPHYIKELKTIESEEAFSEFLNAIGYKIDTILPPKGGNWSQWRKNIEKSREDSTNPF